MTRVFYSVVLLLWAPLISAVSCPEQLGVYSYFYIEMQPDGPTFPHSMQIDVKRKRVMYGGHVGDGFRNTYCKSDEVLFCIHTNRFSFAVPKNKVVVGEKWTSFGRNYVVKSIQPLAIMNVRTKVFEIVGDSEFMDSNRTYYYSHERGLLAMKRWSAADNNYIMQISDSGVGYPVRKCSAHFK